MSSEVYYRVEAFRDHVNKIDDRVKVIQHMGLYTLRVFVENGTYEALSVPAQFVITDETNKGLVVITQLYTLDMKPSLSDAHSAEIIDGFWHAHRPLSFTNGVEGTVNDGYIMPYGHDVGEVLDDIEHMWV